MQKEEFNSQNILLDSCSKIMQLLYYFAVAVFSQCRTKTLGE